MSEFLSFVAGALIVCIIWATCKTYARSPFEDYLE